MVIEKTKHIPLYLQLKEYILCKIREGKVNDKLPSINDLIKRFNVSLSTINRAMFELEKGGLIERRHGKGIFIVRPEKEIISERGRPKAKRRIVVASPDYPSYELEQRTAEIDKTAHLNGIAASYIKYKQETTYEILADLIKREKNIDGVLYIPPALSIGYDHLALFDSFGIPFVILDEQDIEGFSNLRVVAPDYRASFADVCRYLIECGHTRIAYIGNEPASAATALHLAGLKDGFAERKLPRSGLFATRERIRPWENSLVAGYRFTRTMCASSNATAYVYDTSTGAFGGLRALAEAGRRVPEDVSVIGENDWQYFEYANPPLSVVRNDIPRIMETAIAIVKEPASHPQTTRIPSRIIQRRSTAPCAATVTQGGQS